MASVIRNKPAESVTAEERAASIFAFFHNYLIDFNRHSSHLIVTNRACLSPAPAIQTSHSSYLVWHVFQPGRNETLHL